MLSSFVDGLRGRYRRQMQKQTQELEPHMRTQLVEYVQDGLIDATTVDDDDEDDTNNHQEQPRLTTTTIDSDTIQNELDIAHENISKLQSKEEFIAVRLTKYKQVPQDKLTEQQKEQLCNVETIHKNMVQQIQTLEKRITQLEQQQFVIQMQKEECEDFLDIAHQIEIEQQRQRLGLTTNTELIPVNAIDNNNNNDNVEVEEIDESTPTDDNLAHDDDDDKDGNIELGESNTAASSEPATVETMEDAAIEQNTEVLETADADHGDGITNANDKENDPNDVEIRGAQQ